MVWKELPIRSSTTNPKETRVRTFANRDVRVYIRTFVESNIIGVWKENRRTRSITNNKRFKNDFYGSKKAYKFARQLMRYEKINGEVSR